MSKPFLERIKISSFGAFSGKVVGPLSPHLNVVYGRNEAGKTTLSAFVGGVLFGWEDARGNRNTYKPANAERAGSLFFSIPPCEESEQNEPFSVSESKEIELSRVRNADGLRGDTSLVGDIDKETFQTMFALTSDELRSLRNTTDVTAKLLTAGSGTGASPAHALAQVDDMIATYTSRAASAEYSLVRLEAEQDEVRAKLSAAGEEAERLKREDKEFHDLEPQRDHMLARLDELNTEIESLTAMRTQVEKLDHEIEDARENVAALRREEAELKLSHSSNCDEDLASLVALTSSEERVLRDRIDALTSEQTKCEHAVDLAQDNFATSRAAYEALLENEDAKVVEERARRQRNVQITLSIVLPLMFVCAGVPLFVHGREITSLSFTVLGLGLLLFAAMVALAALVMLFRPNKEVDEQEARKNDAQWIMLQDKKKLEACQQTRETLRERIHIQLDSLGLMAAHGSLHQSRELLDEAREYRSEENLYQQRRQALVSRRRALEETVSSTEAQRSALFDRIAWHDERTVDAISALIDQKSQQRTGLIEASEGLNRRYGELKHELSQAKNLRDFDELKLRYEQLRTQESQSAREYARLLLAKRMLEASIAAWESKSQPEVYRQASRLLSLMTDGVWVKVDMTPEGRLQVTDAVKTTREPLHLSLGTCQQLYLALRIALLMEADNVGRAIPILADDILVNFDSVRRVGAARALAELAQVRQVILFTCHEEIVETIRKVDPTANEVEL